MDRVVIGHSSCTDAEYLTQLYESGCTVGWDQFSIPAELGDEGAVVDLLTSFLGQGRASQTVLSGDYGPFVDWDEGESHGYGRVPEVIVPKLREKGVGDEPITTMLVGNPARILSRTPASPG